MPNQVFDTAFVDRAAPGLRAAAPYAERCFVWGAPLFLGIPFAIALFYLFSWDGRLENIETILLALTTYLFVWECVPAATAVLGLLTPPDPSGKHSTQVLRIAILLPMHGEDARVVIGNGAGLLQSLSAIKAHRFKLFVLSDTWDPKLRAAELAMIEKAGTEVSYYNRNHNTDHKSGNIRAWVEREAADYDAMLVLDADSQMTPDCVIHLADRLALDPCVGLVQTMPRVLRGETVWQWTQFYAAKIYGPPLGFGSARWMSTEANSYGHNVLVRTKAFAACAGLPRIRNEDGIGEVIMSHDFVEAALLRRAGWGVQFLPELDGSFESGPRTLIDFIKRDARWGFGNLQHLQILGAKGFHGVSRWHLFHGAVTYLNAILWCCAVISWASLARDLGFASFAATGAVGCIFLMLLLPKVIGLMVHARQYPQRFLHLTLLRDFFFELILSSAVTPTLIIHRVKTVVQFALGMKTSWASSSASHPAVRDTMRFHRVEVFLGLGLLACVWFGALSFFILPVALCLVFSPVLSWSLAKVIA